MRYSGFINYRLLDPASAAVASDNLTACSSSFFVELASSIFFGSSRSFGSFGEEEELNERATFRRRHDTTALEVLEEEEDYVRRQWQLLCVELRISVNIILYIQLEQKLSNAYFSKYLLLKLYRHMLCSTMFRCWTWLCTAAWKRRFRIVYPIIDLFLKRNPFSSSCVAWCIIDFRSQFQTYQPSLFSHRKLLTLHTHAVFLSFSTLLNPVYFFYLIQRQLSLKAVRRGLLCEKCCWSISHASKAPREQRRHHPPPRKIP